MLLDPHVTDEDTFWEYEAARLDDSLKVLVVTGPRNCSYDKWFREPGLRYEYSSRRFFEWVWNGLTVAGLSLFGPPYSDIPAKRVGTKDKQVRGMLSILLPLDFPLAPDVQLYLDIRRNCPYFPHTMVTYTEGVYEGSGLYLDPVDHPQEGKFSSPRLGLADPSRWLYWPQSRYR